MSGTVCTERLLLPIISTVVPSSFSIVTYDMGFVKANLKLKKLLEFLEAVDNDEREAHFLAVVPEQSLRA